jgi:NAD(P)-dependent dehydrogenase (short-subunit alcohol dehydrogenase family)
MNEKFNLEGKVAIITGSSKGIGESIARGMAQQGATVILSSRNKDAVQELKEKFRAEGLSAYGQTCNVGDEKDLKNLAEYTIKKCSKIDIIVNNAATNPVYATLDQTDIALFDKMIQVNLKGPFVLSNLVFPYFKSQKAGNIIHISSVEGLRPSKGLGLYGINKAALIALTKSQAKEWGKYNIRVNAILPGLIKTKFSEAMWTDDKLVTQWLGNIPLKRIGTPEEMAGLATFLASEASSYCTGQCYIADGGYMVS